MAAGNLWINLGLRTAAFNRGVNRSRGQVRRFGSDIRGVNRTLAVLGRTVGVVGGVYGMGLLAKSMISTASAAEETQAKFDTVFKELAGSSNLWAEEFGDSVGRASHEVKDWMATLQDTFVPLGIARAEAAELSKNLVKLGVDVASLNNAADAEVIRDFTSALVGNHETVRKYGILISETAIKQAAMNAGISKSYKQLTDLEKVQLRYNIIQAGTSDAQGDALRTADSYAGQVKRLNANWAEFKASVGQVITSPLADLIKDVNWLVQTGFPNAAEAYEDFLQRTGVIPKAKVYRPTFDPNRRPPEAAITAPDTTVRTPLSELRGPGLMSPEQRRMATGEFLEQRRLYEKNIANARAKQHERMINSQLDDLDKYEEENRRVAEAIEQKWQSVGHTMEYSMTSAFDRIIWEGEKFGDAMTSMLREVGREMGRQFIFQPFTQSLMGAFGFKIAGAPAATPVTIQGERQHGGYIPETGLYKLHAGETVDTAAAKLKGGDGASAMALKVEVINQGQPVRVVDSEVSNDGSQAVVRVFLADMETDGPMSQRLKSMGISQG